MPIYICTYLAYERLLAGVNSNMARQFVAPAEPSLAIIQWTTERPLLHGRLRGPVRVLARLDRF